MSETAQAGNDSAASCLPLSLALALALAIDAIARFAGLSGFPAGSTQGLPAW